jgi:hypothetical protein
MSERGEQITEEISQLEHHTDEAQGINLAVSIVRIMTNHHSELLDLI